MLSGLAMQLRGWKLDLAGTKGQCDPNLNTGLKALLQENTDTTGVDEELDVR